MSSSSVHGDSTAVRRNQRRVLRIPLFVQFDPKEADFIADPAADERYVRRKAETSIGGLFNGLTSNDHV